jgi:succinate dehydrogenase hydrophobic anchor subunit
VASPSIPVPGTRDRRAADEAHAARHDWSFVWQAVSGAAVLGLVTIHMVANHFVVPEGLRNFAQVVAYLSSPVIVVLEVAFLVTVTWHGLLGLRAVLMDFGFSPWAERWITRILAVVGVATVGYGLWVTSVIVGQT